MPRWHNIVPRLHNSVPWRHYFLQGRKSHLNFAPRKQTNS
nr:MAG TPA: hypothetical protein [Caudoviricetes sp.]